MDDVLQRFRWPIIGVLVLLIASGLGVLYVRWPRLPAASIASLPARQAIKVHVSGAVTNPGVYAFQDGDRVEDAIRAAGGFASDADASRLNLAQRLRDEGIIVVPRLGETPVPGRSAVSPAPGQPDRVNINTATVAELDKLPGIGATYAKRIVDYRTQNGPFQRTDDLVDKKLLPASTFAKIKDLIDVQ